MLVHRSTESLVIERLDIPATESPYVERDSFIFLDEDYWELEHDELSPVKTRPLRSRTMGTMLLWFQQWPQERVHTRVRHSWSEESPEGTCPTICDLGRCPFFTKGPSRGTCPSLLNRKKERTFFEQAHSNECGGPVNSQMLAKKIMRQGPLVKAGCQEMSEMSTPLMEFSFKMLHHVKWRVHRLSPRSLPNEKSVPLPSKAWLLRSGAA